MAGNQLDVLVNNTAAAAWNNNGDGDWSETTKWVPTEVPQGPGQTATFGNGDGTTTTINAPTVAVTIDGAYSIGTSAVQQHQRHQLHHRHRRADSATGSRLTAAAREARHRHFRQPRDFRQL